MERGETCSCGSECRVRPHIKHAARFTVATRQQPQLVAARNWKLSALIGVQFGINAFVSAAGNMVLASSVAGNGISDPFRVLFAVKIQVNKTLSRRRVEQRVTGSGLEAFREAVAGVNWSHVVATTDANVTWNIFSWEFVEFYKRVFPSRAYSPVKKSKKEWITSSFL